MPQQACENGNSCKGNENIRKGNPQAGIIFVLKEVKLDLQKDAKNSQAEKGQGIFVTKKLDHFLSEAFFQTNKDEMGLMGDFIKIGCERGRNAHQDG